MIPPLRLSASDFPEEVAAALGAVQRLSCPPQGDTSTIAIVESAGGTYAVKRSRGGRFSAWLSQEYRVLRALAQTPLPTPQPQVFVRREVAGESETWLVMEFLPGEPLAAAVEKAADQAERRSLLRAFGYNLAGMHQAAIPAELQGETRPWLDCMLERAEYALLLEGKVTGVNDWAFGGPGDPRCDLALAIRPQAAGHFQTPRDRHAFFEGYALADLSASEYDYFVRTYAFF